MFRELIGSQEKQHQKRLKKDPSYAYAYYNEPVEIYAELSRKQLHSLCSGDMTMTLPYGSSFRRKRGRGFSILCADRQVASMVESGLDVSGIPWQEI